MRRGNSRADDSQKKMNPSCAVAQTSFHYITLVSNPQAQNMAQLPAEPRIPKPDVVVSAEEGDGSKLAATAVKMIDGEEIGRAHV